MSGAEGNKLSLGYSTGTLLELIPDEPKNGFHIFERIKTLQDASTPGSCIEINFASIDYLNPELIEGLTRYWNDQQASRTFSYISIHVPGGIIYDDSPIANEALNLINLLVRGIGASTVVFHPQQINLEKVDLVLNSLAGIACVENMDSAKKIARGVDELKEYVDAGFGLVLDVNHSGHDDEGRKIASDIIDAYSSSIHHIHASGGHLEDESIGNSHTFYTAPEDIRNLEPIRGLIPQVNRVNIIHEGIMSLTEGGETAVRLKNELLKVAGKILE